MPVEITGFSETPNVGDELVEMENERAAKKLGEERQEELRKQRLAQPRKARMEELLAMMGDGTQKAQLKILLKGMCRVPWKPSGKLFWISSRTKWNASS